MTFTGENLFIQSVLDIDIGQIITESLYLWNSIIPIIIYHKKKYKTYTYLKQYTIIMYEVSLLSLSKMPQTYRMVCIFALLMTISYFGKQEATLQIKQSQIDKYKRAVL